MSHNSERPRWDEDRRGVRVAPDPEFEPPLEVTLRYNKWNDVKWLKDVLAESEDQLETIIGYFRTRLRVGQERLPVDEAFMQNRIDRFEKLLVDRYFAEEKRDLEKQKFYRGSTE